MKKYQEVIDKLNNAKLWFNDKQLSVLLDEAIDLIKEKQWTFTESKSLRIGSKTRK